MQENDFNNVKKCNPIYKFNSCWFFTVLDTELNIPFVGIDVEQVTVVVNFDLPVDMQHQADCETYLHRYALNYGYPIY